MFKKADLLPSAAAVRHRGERFGIISGVVGDEAGVEDDFGADRARPDPALHEAGVAGLGVPVEGNSEIPRHSHAMVIEHAEVVHRRRISAGGGEKPQTQRFGIIFST